MRSNQLSYPAIILLSGCKGTTFLGTTKIFGEIFCISEEIS